MTSGRKNETVIRIDSVDALRSHLTSQETTIAELREENARLWRSYELIKEELELLKRRIYVAKAERVDTTQLQLEFAELLGKLEALSGAAAPEADVAPTDEQDTDKPGDRGSSPDRKRGRRRLEDTDLPVVRIEIEDDLFEDLVARGKAERIGFEESSKLGYQRGGLRRVEMARVKYRAINGQGEAEIETAPLPPEVVPRCLATPSTLAFISTSKFCDGLPLYRIEDIFDRMDFPLDRGTMSRWLEQIGATFGATVIEAAHKDAIENAFCILTDATGFAIQPEPSPDGKRRACRKGHYFVKIADRDHILFEFTPKENSDTVRAIFKGYDGYLQADAKSVYDVLFRPPRPGDLEDDGCTRIEVACWAHARRKYWEAALAKQSVAREALVRIGQIFDLDARIRKDKPPGKIKELRQKQLAPLVDAFLDFASVEYAKVEHQRGSLRSALGYTVRQREAMRAFLADGRLRLDNNPSEAALRKVVIVRDSALFAGSDEHAVAAAHILSMIASARLHDLEPERYLRDMLRVIPHWPRDRYLELVPKYWVRTRLGLIAAQLDAEIGPLTIPAPLDP